MREIYFCVDIETDGPCPGLNSMLSIGVVVMDYDLNVVDELYKTLTPLPDAHEDARTMGWWKDFPNELKAARENPCDPLLVMREISLLVEHWTRRLRDDDESPRPVFVAQPAGFDFTFVYYYAHRFLSASPFGHRALDMRSLGMGLTDLDFIRSSPRNYPKEWDSPLAHTHNALDDAREQADIFRRMMRFKRQRDQKVDQAGYHYCAHVELLDKDSEVITSRLYQLEWGPKFPTLEEWEEIFHSRSPFTAYEYETLRVSEVIELKGLATKAT